MATLGILTGSLVLTEVTAFTDGDSQSEAKSKMVTSIQGSIGHQEKGHGEVQRSVRVGPGQSLGQPLRAV